MNERNEVEYIIATFTKFAQAQAHACLDVVAPCPIYSPEQLFQILGPSVKHPFHSKRTMTKMVG